MGDNPFLNAPAYAPVLEERDLTDLPIEGTLPALDGWLLRNGPNPRFAPLGRYHWFDGDGMVHALRFSEGRASYSNRFVRTPELAQEEAAGKALWRGMRELPFENPNGMMKNPANTALVAHAGKLLALWESGKPTALSLPALSTRGPYDFEGALKTPFTAHPKIDPRTGEMFAIGYQFFAPFLTLHVVAPSGRITRSVPIELPQAVMMHDFAITERFVLFFDLPLTFSVKRVMNGGPILQWEPELGARIGVMPRQSTSSDVRWFSLPSFYMYHSANAYEEGDHIVLTGVRQQTPGLVGNAGAAEGGRMHRFRLALSGGTIADEPIDDVPVEFVRVHEGRLTEPLRYAYAAELDTTTTLPRFRGVRKIDQRRGGAIAHHYGEGRSGGEMVFVPRPDAHEEDDGHLLGFVFDETRGASEVVALDARDLSQVARVVLPIRVPAGFHAAWVPA